jgi:coenzyme F420-0:L-glutamate ligase/coenzyme F420-1:gamma-L-glutamate ligase
VWAYLQKITLIGLKAPIIKSGDSISEILYKTLKELKVSLDEGDVIVVAETPVAMAEGSIVKLDEVVPSERAKELAAKYQMDPRVVEVVIGEADEILGGVTGVLLTIKYDTLIANAGADLSNATLGHMVLYPRNPLKSAQEIKQYLETKFHKKIAVIIADSRVQPLRRGTTGVALAVAGMEPIEDFRGRKDLFGRELKIKLRAVADDLTSAAELVMGEAAEQIPAVLIKGAPIQLTEHPSFTMAIAKSDCLFMNCFSKD